MDEYSNYKSLLDFSKIKRNIIPKNENFGGKELVFLVLSGSFNPIHRLHTEIFEMAKVFFEKNNKKVIGGFIAPSCDDYLIKKLGKDAMPLLNRIKLCDLAVQDSNWLNVCRWGQFSSNIIQQQIKELIELELKDILNGHSVKGIEIMGSDTVVRDFEEVLQN